MSTQASSHTPVVVVLEGLDGVGKSTAAAGLAAKLGAHLMVTPPPEITPFRDFFDQRPELRPGFYMTGNFIASRHMAETVAAGRSVVCDRFYASTISYPLGKRGELPSEGSPEYAWPSELLRPTHMIQLVLPEVDRIARRASRRSVAETPEEAELREDAARSARVSEAFTRMGCVSVSAEGTTAEVVQRILDLIGEH